MWFVDNAGIGYAFRTEVLQLEVRNWKGQSCPLHEGVTDDCVEYIRRCGDLAAGVKNECGDHWFDIDGVDRQNNQV